MGVLHSASFCCQGRHTDIVGILLQYGADATAKFGLSWQDTPLQKAIDRGQHDMISILQSHLQSTLHSNSLGESMAALIKERNEDEIKRWIDENPDAINLSDERGNSPLHWAVMTRQIKLIDFFIQKGVDLEAERADGCKAVHLAMEGDYFYRSNRNLPAESIQNEWFLLGYLISKGAHYDMMSLRLLGIQNSFAISLYMILSWPMLKTHQEDLRYITQQNKEMYKL